MRVCRDQLLDWTTRAATFSLSRRKALQDSPMHVIDKLALQGRLSSVCTCSRCVQEGGVQCWTISYWCNRRQTRRRHDARLLTHDSDKICMSFAELALDNSSWPPQTHTGSPLRYRKRRTRKGGIRACQDTHTHTHTQNTHTQSHGGPTVLGGRKNVTNCQEKPLVSGYFDFPPALKSSKLCRAFHSRHKL